MSAAIAEANSLASRTTRSGRHSSIVSSIVGSIASTFRRAKISPTTTTSPCAGGSDGMDAQSGPSTSSGGVAPARNGYPRDFNVGGPTTSVSWPFERAASSRGINGPK